MGQPLQQGYGAAEINPTSRELPAWAGGLLLTMRGMNVALDGTPLEAELATFNATWRGRAAAWLDRQSEKLGPQGLVGKLAPREAFGARMAIGMASGILRIGVGYGMVRACGLDRDCVLTEEQTWAVGLYGLGDAAAVAEMVGGLASVSGRAALRAVNEAMQEVADDAMGAALRGFGDDLTQMARGPSFAPRGPAVLPELPGGYHYRTVGGSAQVVRNPGRAADLPQMHLADGQLMLGPSPSVARSMATRRAFLQSLNPKDYPKWMARWLIEGRVPPFFRVHHKKALFDGGTDTIDNMVLQAFDLHNLRHKFYRPGGRIPSINPP